MRDNSVRAKLNVGKLEVSIDANGQHKISDIGFNEGNCTIVPGEEKLEKYVMAKLQEIPGLEELLEEAFMPEIKDKE